MNKITICYSTHRPETLELTARVMEGHDLLVLEEPAHDDFAHMLSGNIAIKEHLLELDVGYPEFTAGQYQLLQHLSKSGKQIVQVEPYLEHLLGIHYFFAEGHSPEEIEPNTLAYSVYRTEKKATGLLINYYHEARGDDFEQLLSSMNAFAVADAARFVLRDTLRAEHILNILRQGCDTYIEAGSIHLLLYQLLAKGLSKEWRLLVHSVDREAVTIVNRRGNLFSPGDILTLYYIWSRKVSRIDWQLKCAQSLIYSKIVQKEEIATDRSEYPHTHNELDSIAAVKQLTTENCRNLFQQTRSLSSEESAEVVQRFIKDRQ